MSGVRLFQDANALDSLRSSDFDAVSAYGEVVDNSIEAGAKNVKIRFFNRPFHGSYQKIDRLAFGDDGIGMDAETLQNCLQIGWSSRYNNRSGIGRFGVGMTMGAIHECKRVDVWSKQKGSPWLHTHIDLDKVASGEQARIPEPTAKPLPGDCISLVGAESGTLVIWSDYDRQEASADRLVENSVVWIGRTYRYFMWEDGVRIFVNGQPVPAIDPLYATTQLTRFTDDPPAHVFAPIEIEWKVDTIDLPENELDKSKITVRLSRLPEEFRPSQGSGRSKDAVARFIDMNEGVSILRARREVFYGPIPYWSAAGKGFPQFEEIDRWWGCEISFDPVLDRAFTVKNIKRGAVPETELKKVLHARITPTRNDVLEEVRAVWTRKRQEQDQARSEEEIPRPGDHRDAERAAKQTRTDKNRIDEGKDFDQEANRVVDRYRDRYDEQQQQKLKELFREQPFTIMEANWRGPQLFEINHLGGSAVLEYNRNHLFWDAVYSRFESLEEGGENYQAAHELKALLDLLIMSYGKAETRFDPDEQIRASDLLDQLRSNLGQYLNSYVRTWMNTREEA
jgi:hypothetical protein